MVQAASLVLLLILHGAQGSAAAASVRTSGLNADAALLLLSLALLGRVHSPITS